LNAEPDEVINEITSTPGFIFVIGQSEKEGGSLHHLSPGYSHLLNVRKV